MPAGAVKPTPPKQVKRLCLLLVLLVGQLLLVRRLLLTVPCFSVFHRVRSFVRSQLPCHRHRLSPCPPLSLVVRPLVSSACAPSDTPPSLFLQKKPKPPKKKTPSKSKQ